MAFTWAMPPGTVTVSDVSDAAVTVAVVPPEEPMLPPAGAKDVMVGAAAWATPEKTRVAASASSATPAFRTLIFLFVTLIPFARRFAKCTGRPSPMGGVRFERNQVKTAVVLPGRGI